MRKMPNCLLQKFEKIIKISSEEDMQNGLDEFTECFDQSKAIQSIKQQTALLKQLIVRSALFRGWANLPINIQQDKTVDFDADTIISLSDSSESEIESLDVIFYVYFTKKFFKEEKDVVVLMNKTLPKWLEQELTQVFKFFCSNKILKLIFL